MGTRITNADSIRSDSSDVSRQSPASPGDQSFANVAPSNCRAGSHTSYMASQSLQFAICWRLRIIH
jgi:hypothetical protein